MPLSVANLYQIAKGISGGDRKYEKFKRDHIGSILLVFVLYDCTAKLFAKVEKS